MFTEESGVLSAQVSVKFKPHVPGAQNFGNLIYSKHIATLKVRISKTISVRKDIRRSNEAPKGPGAHIMALGLRRAFYVFFKFP